MACNDKIKKIIEMELFDTRSRHHISSRDYVDLTVKRMRVIFHEGLINNDMWLGQNKQSKFEELCQNIALFGTLDLSLGISLAAHLIAGNVILTQSSPQQVSQYRDEVINLDRIYSFCCTEIACGTNLRNIKTTVTYDHTQKRLFLHSPTPDSYKFWIGNALYSATVGMVLARLIVNNRDEGIHWFRVPLRDEENGSLLPGIRAISCDPKGGVEGYQISGIRFDQVSLPPDAMMQRHAEITQQGTFYSQFSKSQRFASLFETFLQERIFPLSSGSLSAAVALYITYKFSEHRVTSLKPTYQTLIMEPLFCQRLYPELLKAFSLHVLNKVIIHQFKKNWDDKSTHKKLQILVAVGKYLGSSLGLDILRKCRAMCGAQGLHHYNQIMSMQIDYEANITFAGDNSVMSYQIAKYMIGLDRFKNDDVVPQNIAQEVEKSVVADCHQRRFTHAEAQALTYTYALDLIIQEIQEKRIVDKEILQDLSNSFIPYMLEKQSFNVITPTIEKINYLMKILTPPIELITAPIINQNYTEIFTSELYTTS
ncbi:acyl-CoA dehydrogenase [Pectobacterium carotovorum subsp. carotovorum]|nr:acyl-CoA dehydrogenase [Pectobacterium carotovorum subsp. carotovorum]